jgi:hypothetical protein
MTFRVFLQKAGKSAIRRIAVLLVFVPALTGCDRDTPLLMVKAVAAGVPSLAPFFDESAGLGRDQQVRSQTAHGGLQQGDTPGLYGGSKQPTICDLEKLKGFLDDPTHARKAQAWASVLSLTTEEIPDYLDRLTPVLLRHDTLVRNHDYKKEKAVPFNSLLQAGIAILVDGQGLPAVKCSCGNPLRPFEGDTTRIKVDFDGANVKWKGYEKSSVVAVRPAPRKMERLALVDVEDPDRGIARPVGTTGKHDTAFDTRERRAVPSLAGARFGQASRLLADKGLAVAYDGHGLPPNDARVTASDPPAGTELRFGEYVTLSVAGGTSGGPTTPPTSGSGTGSGTGPGAGPGSGSSPPSPGSSASSPSAAPSTSTPSSPSASTPPPSSSGSAGPGPTSGPPSSAPPSSNTPPGSEPPASTKEPAGSPPPPASSSPPKTTSAPPPSTPATSSTPPPETSAPVSSAPGTSAPASSTPATRRPASDGPAAGAALQPPRSAPADRE